MSMALKGKSRGGSGSTSTSRSRSKKVKGTSKGKGQGGRGKEQGKGRRIEREMVLGAGPEEVYRLWTTKEGIESWLASEANVDVRAGGKYAIRMGECRDKIRVAEVEP